MSVWGSRASRWGRFWSTLAKRSFAARSVADHLEATADPGLRRCLSALDLTFLGLGSIIGAGVYVLSGVAASQHAGPAVVLSFMVAALAALLSALCYAEFAVEMPISGGAFNYIRVTFGELAAWATSWNMCLETTLSSAAVARGFASYLATLVGLAPADVRFKAGPFELDPLALLLIALLTGLLAKGTRESALFNLVVVCCNLSVIAFILLAGFPLAHPANLSPFLPFGATGMFSAASIVFFGFVGFDYLANAAEEAIDPGRSLPIGLLASLGVATVLYALMSLALVLMVPYTAIDVHAPFSAAFVTRGLAWAGKVVSCGAVFGIVASTMTGMLGQTRLFVVLGRERLLPGWLAAIHPATATPVKATLLTGACAGLLAVSLDIGVLAELVSVGTLFVFAMVCAAVLHRRCYQPSRTPSSRPVLARLLALVVASAGASVSFTFGLPWWVVLACLLGWAGVTASFWLLPLAHTPPRFTVPLFPLTPAAGVLCTVHLIGSLGWPAYVRFGVWMALGLLIYALYGAHAAEEREVQLVLQRTATEEEAAAGESSEAYELPFRLPSLDYEGAVGAGGIELQAWSPAPSPKTLAEAAEYDRAALLRPGQRDSAAAANGASSGGRPP